MVSALGFGVAYYFDMENGGARRAKLRETMKKIAHNMDSVVPPEVGDPPPDFHPVVRDLRAGGPEPGTPETARVVAR